MLLIMIPMIIKAVEVEIDGIKYEVVKKGKVAAVKRGGNYSGDIIIPPSIIYEDVTCDVTSIGDQAFYNCPNLTSITIPNSVTSIGSSAFWNCYRLQKVIVNDIAGWCNISFYDSYSNPLSYAHHLYSDENTVITDLIIPEGVTSIGNYAFYNCSSLTSVNIPNSVTSIGKFAFDCCSSLTSINIPNGVTSIGIYAFRGCGALTSIDIPNSVTSIEFGLFDCCSSLTSITIPNSVTSIGEQAFARCSSLETVVIGDGVSTIERYAFQDCNKIKSITLGSNVSKICEYNFINCEDLEVVTCKAMYPPNFYNEYGYAHIQSFSGSYIEYAKLIVPDESIDAYKAADVWKDFGTIEGLSGNTTEPQKCATPTIHYANGQLTFECETEEVTYQTTISDPDITSYSSNNINLTGKYNVKVYATKPGFDDSDTATLDINLLEGSGPAIKGDVNGDGLVNISDVTDIINTILGK